MLNIKFHGAPLTVKGDQLKVGDKAPVFTAVKMDLQPWSLSDAHGVKIISVVPSLDTGVCQIQTKHFNKVASELKGVDIITISLDLPFAQGRWCGAEGIDNITIISDYQDRDFASKYNLLIDQLKLLTRAVIILDKDNVVKYVQYLEEITEEPNYDAAIFEAKALL